MNNNIKIWLLAAFLFIIIGLIIFSSVMTAYRWDFTKLTTEKFETNNFEIDEEFSNISINTDTADIIFSPSNDEICKIVCYEQVNFKHSVGVENGTLVINLVGNSDWYNHIGINFKKPKITVYLPKTEYSLLSIKASTGNFETTKDFKFVNADISLTTGDIKIQKIHTDTLNLSVSTGNISAQSIKCSGNIKIIVSTGETNITDTISKNLISNGSTGNIYLKNVVAENKFSIKRSTGDVNFSDSDAAKIFIETDTGDVKGSLLTDKVFITETDTGNVDVPKTSNGGKCEIKTDTGNIKIDISK